MNEPKGGLDLANRKGNNCNQEEKKKKDHRTGFVEWEGPVL